MKENKALVNGIFQLQQEVGAGTSLVEQQRLSPGAAGKV